MAEEENIIEKFKSKEFGFNGRGSIVRYIIGNNVFIVKDNNDGTYNFIKISKSDYDNFYKNENLKENNDVSKAIIDYIEFDQTFFNKNKDKFIKSLNDQQLTFDDVKQMTIEKFKSLKVSNYQSQNINGFKPEHIPEPIPEKKDDKELMGDDEEIPIQEEEKKDDGEKPIEEKKGQPTLSKEDKELFRTFKDKYKFELKNENAGFAFTRVGDDIIFVRKIGTNKKGFAQYKDGPYLILKTNAKKFKKIKDNEVAKVAKKEKEEAEGMADDDKEKEKKDDNIFFEYFNFSNDYFKDNEKKFADSLKKKKFLFDNLDDKEKKEVNYFGWNEFKDLDIIPGIKVKDTYKDRLEKFNVDNIQENNFVKREEAKEKEKDLFGEKDFFDIENEEPIQENEPLPKKEDVEIEDDIDYTDSDGMKDTDIEGMTDSEDAEKQRQGFDKDEDDDDIPEINVPELRQQQQRKQQRKQQRQRKQLIQDQNNQLIAGHTPNGEELRALIKYNNNSDSLLKLIVSLSNDNKGEVDFKEIGEIQDLNGDITDLYSKMQDLKSKINSSNNAEEKERLLIKYNEKRLKLEDLVKKYSKEAYRLSTLNKKKKATMATHKYLMNKLNKL